ncbi:right-handed parallel beta-helix repeat-containing protein [bacterium]|nr:right-handed parallel beta-helix repeat-containing protein [bacterium]
MSAKKVLILTGAILCFFVLFFSIVQSVTSSDKDEPKPPSKEEILKDMKLAQDKIADFKTPEAVTLEKKGIDLKKLEEIKAGTEKAKERSLESKAKFTEYIENGQKWKDDFDANKYNKILNDTTEQEIVPETILFPEKKEKKSYPAFDPQKIKDLKKAAANSPTGNTDQRSSLLDINSKLEQGIISPAPIKPGPDPKPMAFTYVNTWSFETGMEGWTTSDLSVTAPVDYWQIDDTNVFAGTYSWHMGLPSGGYDNLWNQFITYDVDLSTAVAPVSMSFMHEYDVEGGWDWCAIDVFAFDPATGTDRWYLFQTNYTGDSAGWIPGWVDLSAYAGQNIKIRFRFNSDWTVTNPAGGWWWDELTISDLVSTFLYDNAESGNIGWQINGQIGDYWARSNLLPADGAFHLMCVDASYMYYAPGMDNAVISPDIDLSANPPLTAQTRLSMQVAYQVAPGGEDDWFVIEISTDGGTNYFELDRYRGNSGGYLPYVANISEYSGYANTKIRLRLEAENDPYTNGAVLADSIAVSIDPAPAPIEWLAVSRIVGTDTGLYMIWPTNPEVDIDHYNIYRSTASGLIGTKTLIHSLPAVIGSEFHDYTDVGLLSGSTYYYQVTAVDADPLEGEPSNEAFKYLDPAPPICLSGAILADYTMGPGIVPVCGDIFISETATLTILPGTTIEFDGQFDENQIGRFPDRCEFLIAGKLIANGTNISRILFTSDTAVVDDWGWIFFIGGADPTSTISYADFEYGNIGLAGENDGFMISNCTFDNFIGAALEISNGCNAIIQNCQIQNVNTWGMGIAAVVLYYNASCTMTDTVIDAPGSNGLLLVEGTLFLDTVTVQNVDRGIMGWDNYLTTIQDSFINTTTSAAIDITGGTLSVDNLSSYDANFTGTDNYIIRSSDAVTTIVNSYIDVGNAPFGLSIEDQSPNTVTNTIIDNVIMIGIFEQITPSSNISANTITLIPGAMMGVLMDTVNTGSISNNTITDGNGGAFGIGLFGCFNSTVVIDGNDIDTTGNIYSDHSKANIANNDLFHYNVGIYQIQGSSNTISANDIVGIGGVVTAGIYCEESSMTVSNNPRIASSGMGIFVLNGIGETASISNNTIRDNDEGIYLVNSENVTISGNTVYDQINQGIAAFTCRNIDITASNDIYQNALGLHLSDVNAFNVLDNQCYNNTMVGIVIETSSIKGIVNGNTVTGHIIGGPGVGCLVNGNCDVNFAGNRFENNFDGITVDSSTVNFDGSNQISQNTDFGIWLDNNTTYTVQNNNDISTNTWGIVASNNSTGTIDGNTFTGNASYGIGFETGGYGLVKNNTLTGNDFGVSIFDNCAPNLGDLWNGDPNDDGNNIIQNNVWWAVENWSPQTIMAQGNYWDANDCQDIDEFYIFDDDENGASGQVIYNLGAPVVLTTDVGEDEDIMHLTGHLPLIEWTFNDPDNHNQRAYQIQVSSDDSFLLSDMWDSGWIWSSDYNKAYAGNPLEDGATYWLRVKLHDGCNEGNWGPTVVFHMNSLPSAPALVSPIDGAISNVSDLVINNSNDDEGDTQNYDFEVYTDSMLTTPMADHVLDQPEGAGTTTWTADLADNATYYWRARAYDGYEYGDWAGAEDFWLNAVNEDPEAFNLVSPADGSIVNNTTSVSVAWDSTTDPDLIDSLTYTVWYSTFADFSYYKEITGIMGTSQLLTNLDHENDTYYWKVKAVDDHAASTWSNQTWTFEINAMPENPNTFSLILPTDNETAALLRPTFKWNTATDNDPGDIVSYNLRYGLDPTFAVYSEITGISGTQYALLTDLQDDSVYYWYVIAQDSTGGTTASTETTWAFDVNLGNNAPDAFSLSTLTYGQMTNNTAVALDWQDAADSDPGDAVTYELRYSIDPTFNTGTVIVPGLAVSQWNGVLADNTIYYWKVKAIDANGGETWSTETDWYFSVNTINDAPGAFALTAPADVSVLVTLTPTMKWDASADIDPEDGVTYTLRYSQDPIFAVYDDIIGITGTEYTFATPFADDTVWYWKVLAEDENAGQTWSTQTWGFTLNVANDAPVAFDLLSPAHAAIVTTVTPTVDWTDSTDSDPGDSITYDLWYSVDPSFATYDIAAALAVSTYTFGGSDLDDNEVYYWKVFANDTNGGATESTQANWSFTVNTINDAPAAFALTAPNDASVLVTLTPTMKWDASADIDPADAVTYTLRYSQDPIFAVYDDIIGITGTEYTFATPFADDTVWYWRVLAEDENAGQTWSTQTWGFTLNIGNDAPAAFDLLSPAHELVVTTVTPTVDWADSSDSDPADSITYDLWYSIDPSFATYDIAAGLAVSTYTFGGSDLDDNEVYYWKVFANDTNGGTTESTQANWSFTVNTINDAPAAFALTAPADASVLVTLTPTMKWGQSLDIDPADAVTYTLRYSQDVTFATYDDIIGITGTEYTFATPFADDTVWYWKVWAQDTNAGATWSTQTWSYTINAANNPPSEFALLTPAYGEVVTTVTPAVDWADSIDPDPADSVTYDLWYSVDPTFATYDIAAGLAVSTYTFGGSDLDDNEVYYWKVFANDTNGGTTESDQANWYFTVNTINDAPAAFSLLSPASGSSESSIRPVLRWEATTDVDPDDEITYTLWWGTDSSFATYTEVSAISAAEYTYTVDLVKGETYYWRIKAVDESAAETWATQSDWYFRIGNVAPIITLTAPPASNATANDIYIIGWTDSDPDDNALISLYYDTDNDMTGGTLITGAVNEDPDGSGDEWVWDTSEVEQGEYYIYAMIDDSYHAPYYACSKGKVVIRHFSTIDDVVMYPNPYNPSEGGKFRFENLPENTMIRIYNLAGRLITSASVNDPTWEWDGRADSGEIVGNGLYFYFLRAGTGDEKTGKLIIIK